MDFMQVFLYENTYKISFRCPLFFRRLINLIPLRIKDQRLKKKRKKTKNSSSYAKFCQDVYNIWDHKCAKCGISKDQTRLTTHHFLSFAREPDFRLDPDAAAPLCRECHSIFHKKFGYIGFTPADFFEFIREDKTILDFNGFMPSMWW